MDGLKGNKLQPGLMQLYGVKRLTKAFRREPPVFGKALIALSRVVVWVAMFCKSASTSATVEASDDRESEARRASVAWNLMFER